MPSSICNILFCPGCTSGDSGAITGLVIGGLVLVFSFVVVASIFLVASYRLSKGGGKHR